MRKVGETKPKRALHAQPRSLNFILRAFGNHGGFLHKEDDIVELLFPKGWAFNPGPNEKGLQYSSSDRMNGKETDVRHMYHEGNISSIWPLNGERIRSQ